MMQKNKQTQQLPIPIHKYAKIIIMIKNLYYLKNIFNFCKMFYKITHNI
jgi:hypothetical protein